MAAGSSWPRWPRILFTKYGTVPIRVSVADPTIRLENGKRVPLSSGMTVVVEVKTGTRKPIEYVLAPLKKYGAESGWERWAIE